MTTFMLHEQIPAIIAEFKAELYGQDWKEYNEKLRGKRAPKADAVEEDE